MKLKHIGPIVINDKSQRTVAKHWRIVAFSVTFYCKFTVESAFLKSFGEFTGKKADCLTHALCAPGYCPAERWRTRQRSWVWQETAVVNYVTSML